MNITSWANIVFTNNPDDIKEIFRLSKTELKAAAANDILKSVVGEESVFIKDGCPHSQARKILGKPFSKVQLSQFKQFIFDQSYSSLEKRKFQKTDAQLINQFIGAALSSVTSST